MKQSYFLILGALCLVLGLSVFSINKAMSQSSPTPTPTPTMSPTSIAPERSVYIARLRPLNDSGVAGELQIVMDDGTVGVAERVFGLAGGIAHQQYVDAGTLCPDAAADTNQDGYIDALEAENYTGVPGTPLAFPDSSFPSAAESGNLNFIQSYVSATFFAGLSPVPSQSPVPQPISSTSPSPSSSPTPSPSASVVLSLSQQKNVLSKAIPEYNANSAPNLEGQVVVIHGIDPSTNLPDSVQALDGYTPQATLPVACGRLRQVLE
jgi:hypothetical protein